MGKTCTLKLAGKPASRFRGLLLTQPDEDALLLIPCRDIHTFGMTHDLDVAFLSAEGMVLASHRNVSPCRRLAHPWAEAVVERFAAPDDPWFVVGEHLRIHP